MDDGQNILDDAVQAALRRAGAEELPEAVARAATRHQQRLRALVRQLHAAGLDENTIRCSIREILGSYEDELVKALLQHGENGEA